MSTDDKPSSEKESPRKYTKEEIAAARKKFINRIRYERVVC